LLPRNGAEAVGRSGIPGLARLVRGVSAICETEKPLLS